MPKRSDVYAAIDGERFYQERKWGAEQDLLPDRTLSIGEEILLAGEYLDKARHEWSIAKRPETKALDMIRKAAAILVHAMEDHGIVERDNYGFPVELTLDNAAQVFLDDCHSLARRISDRNDHIAELDTKMGMKNSHIENLEATIRSMQTTALDMAGKLASYHKAFGEITTHA
jgi:hypothetical protein